jgi:peroxiredoxin
MNNKLFKFSAILCAIAFAGAGAYFANEKLSPKEPQDQAVAQFLASSLTDHQGKPQAAKQWQGKILVLNFWATWCPPCVEEMPELVQLQKELTSQNVQILGIGIDSPSNIKAFSEKHRISYPLFSTGMEGSELSRRFGNQAGGLPFTVLIDEAGNVKKSYLGRLNIKQLHEDILKVSKK